MMALCSHHLTRWTSDISVTAEERLNCWLLIFPLHFLGGFVCRSLRTPKTREISNMAFFQALKTALEKERKLPLSIKALMLPHKRAYRSCF